LKEHPVVISKDAHSLSETLIRHQSLNFVFSYRFLIAALLVTVNKVSKDDTSRNLSTLTQRSLPIITNNNIVPKKQEAKNPLIPHTELHNHITLQTCSAIYS